MFFRSSKTVLEPKFPENSPIRHLKTPPGKKSQGKNPGKNGEDAQNALVFFDKEAGAKAMVVGRIFLGFPVFFFWPKKTAWDD